VAAQAADLDLKAVRKQLAKCNEGHPAGSLLIKSDLKTAEWLASAFLNEGTESIDLTNTSNLKDSSNALSHDIRFEIDTSGGVTPGWKLVPISLNQSGIFFTLSRNRIHEVIFTPRTTPNRGRATLRRIQAPSRRKSKSSYSLPR
jgi:hypothetical protein